MIINLLQDTFLCSLVGTYHGRVSNRFWHNYLIIIWSINLIIMSLEIKEHDKDGWNHLDNRALMLHDHEWCYFVKNIKRIEYLRWDISHSHISIFHNVKIKRLEIESKRHNSTLKKTVLIARISLAMWKLAFCQKFM